MRGEGDIIVERGADPSRLIIAFTGVRGDLSLKPFDFWDLTGTLGYSRILLRDPSAFWFQYGTGGVAHNFPELVEVLRGHIAELAPERLTILGNSMGGFAGILAGHLLEADDVHTFGPFVTLNPIRAARERDGLWRLRRADLIKLFVQQFRHRHLFDLPRLLKKHNGHTSFYVHFCHGSDLAKGGRLIASAARRSRLDLPS